MKQTVAECCPGARPAGSAWGLQPGQDRPLSRGQQEQRSGHQARVEAEAWPPRPPTSESSAVRVRPVASAAGVKPGDGRPAPRGGWDPSPFHTVPWGSGSSVLPCLVYVSHVYFTFCLK